MLNILEAATTLVRNPDRSLIYGVYLPEYLALDDPLTTRCFLNHRCEPVALFPEHIIQDTAPTIRELSVASAL